MDNTENQIIKTIGENGEEVIMKLQEIVNVNNQDYALMSIVKEDTLPTSDNDEEEEIIVMRMIEDGDECTFEIIEDDDEFNLVVSAISDDEEEVEE